jgi:hypothetical protein
MKLDELVVTSRSNGRLNPDRLRLILPYDVEMTSSTGIKALHSAGVEVYYAVLPSNTTEFKLKVSRTIFSAILVFGSKQECQADGFEI